MSPGPPEQNPSDGTPRARAPCAFFFRGGCGRGEACNFAHIGFSYGEAKSKSNMTAKPLIAPCRFYPQCRRGESCVFRHGDESRTSTAPAPDIPLSLPAEHNVLPKPEEELMSPADTEPEDPNPGEYSGELPTDAQLSTIGLDDASVLVADPPPPKSGWTSDKATPVGEDHESQTAEEARSRSEGSQSAEPPWPEFFEGGPAGVHESQSSGDARSQSERNQSAESWSEPLEAQGMEGNPESQPGEDALSGGNQWAEPPWLESPEDGDMESSHEPQPIEDTQLERNQWAEPPWPEFSEAGGTADHRVQPPPQAPTYSGYIPHWTDYADPFSNPLAIFCKFFAQGRCTLGDACSFRHCLTISEYVMLFRNSNPNLWSRPGSVISAQLPAPTSGPPAPTLGPCLFYPLGKCRNGDACPYDHVGAVASGRPAPSDPGHNFSELTSRRHACKYFMEYGSCSKGERCTFVHEDSYHKQITDVWDQAQGDTRDDDGWGPKVSDDGWGSKASDDGWGVKVSEDWFKDPESSEDVSPPQEGEEAYENDQPSSDVAPSTSGWGNDEWVEATGAARTPTQGSRDYHDHGDQHDPRDPPNELTPPPSAGHIPIPNPTNDDEETWNTSWDSPAPALPMGQRIHQPCKYFGQGYCKWGNSCAMLHIPQVDHPESLKHGEGGVIDEDVTTTPPESRPETTPASASDHISFPEQDPADSIFELDLFGCVVSFGPKHSPAHIRTALQPRHIILLGLPPDVLLASVEELLGPSATITLTPGEQGTSSHARVEYMNSVSACDAAETLHGQTIQNHTIEALLDAQADERHAKVSGHCIKLTWPSPSVAAWSYYDTITLAKAEATKLNGFKFQGRKILAAFQKPRRGQTHSFAIQITNLPVDVEKAELEALCTEARNIVVDKPNYVASPNSAIRHLVTRIGPIVDFSIIPVRENASRGVAIASYKTEVSAALAASTLNGSEQIFLGKSPVRVQRIHSAIYNVPKLVYNAIKPDLDCLRDAHDACTVQLFDTTEPFQLVLSAPSDDTVTFGKVNVDLQAILRGHVLIQNGRKVWDNYFTTPSSRKALDQINGKKPYYIQVDSRTESIHLFGSMYEMDRAKTALLRLLQKVHNQQCTIPLDATWMRMLLHGSLDALRARVGSNKILVDVIAPSITVRGDDNILARVREALDEVAASTTLLPTPDNSCCLVCLHAPSTPMALLCQHIYCRQCLQQVVQVSLELPYRPPRCIGRQGDCAEFIPRTILHQLLTPDEEHTLFNLSFLTYIRAHPDKFFFCPQLGCPTLFRTRMQAHSIRCPTCFIFICPSCMVEAHPGMDCLERSSLFVNNAL